MKSSRSSTSSCQEFVVYLPDRRRERGLEVVVENEDLRPEPRRSLASGTQDAVKERTARGQNDLVGQEARIAAYEHNVGERLAETQLAEARKRLVLVRAAAQVVITRHFSHNLATFLKRPEKGDKKKTIVIIKSRS